KRDEAIGDGEKLVERCELCLGPYDQDTIELVSNLAFSYKNRGDEGKAEYLLRDAYRRYAEILGRNHPETLNAAANAGRACERNQKFSDAEVFKLQVLEGYKRCYGVDHEQTL